MEEYRTIKAIIRELNVKLGNIIFNNHNVVMTYLTVYGVVYSDAFLSLNNLHLYDKRQV